MIRTSYNKALGGVLPDDIWKPAIEATGGKFYPAGDEATILERDQGHRSPLGRARRREALQHAAAEVRRLRVHGGRASGRVALTLQLTVPYFRKFP